LHAVSAQLAHGSRKLTVVSLPQVALAGCSSLGALHAINATPNPTNPKRRKLRVVMEAKLTTPKTRASRPLHNATAPARVIRAFDTVAQIEVRRHATANPREARFAAMFFGKSLGPLLEPRAEQNPWRGDPFMRTAIVLSMAVALAACHKTDRNRTDETSEKTPAANVRADNTKKNERDLEPYAVTPENQKENETDRSITQQVRKNVMKNDDLSFNAKNVKIITQDGVVTLRGPVKSEEERAQIAALAQRVDGVKKVDNQLEVAENL
jgi:hypothetical protein